MKSHWIGFLALVILMIPVSSDATQQSAEQLFQSGLYKEEVEGDLQKAIVIYEQILNEFPDRKPVAAKALYHIGLCFEKFGRSGAQEAYRRLIDEYPGQTEEVTLARARLARLGTAAEEAIKEPTFRKIRIPANPENGVLSPDGKNLAFISEESVWIVPIPGKVQPDLAGEPVRLTEPLGARNMGNTMAWSGDGKWIAINAPDNDGDAILVVSASSGQSKKIDVPLYRGRHVYDYRISLSPDGKTLAFTSKDIESLDGKPGKNSPQFLYTIPVAGGSAKRLTDQWSSQPAFSPFGNKIAFIRKTVLENGKDQRDLLVINADGSKPVKLMGFPGRGRGPVWSPDGRMIAVNHAPGADNASQEVWIVRAPENGKPSGSPAKIKLPSASRDMVAGWTSDNKIGTLLMNPAHQAVYTVPIAGGMATQVTPEALGWPMYPKWSPDGERLYLRSGLGNIASIPAQGGKLEIVHDVEKTKVVEGVPGAGNGVSPDGKTILFMAYKEGTRPLEVNIWTVPAEGGEPTQVTKSPTQDRHPSWSPDGKFIAFCRYEQKAKDDYEMNIFLTSSQGGEVRKISTGSNRVDYASIDWSPDGKYIAYFSRDKTINLIPAEGGEHRVLVDVGSVNGHSNLSWSPDGKELAYTSNGRLMVVSLDGGEPREVETGVLKKGVQNFHIDWSPDGGKFVFSARSGGDHELWLMEDFSHLVKEK
jgi:Tol biopolymer transport system component